MAARAKAPSPHRARISVRFSSQSFKTRILQRTRFRKLCIRQSRSVRPLPLAGFSRSHFHVGGLWPAHESRKAPSLLATPRSAQLTYHMQPTQPIATHHHPPAPPRITPRTTRPSLPLAALDEGWQWLVALCREVCIVAPEGLAVGDVHQRPRNVRLREGGREGGRA